ncbi:hypothetical protein ACFYOT_31195 [Saccharothrix saharensis]|uniref:hypothetical protein n=1 Tax=Saccharothrix saharensis TaxID=571190 RepID=UPI0036B41C7F
MTLHADLTALLAAAGLVDVDLAEAVEDEHARWAAYRKIVAVVAGSRSREHDRAVVAAFVRDPVELVGKSAVVELVDRVAARSTDPTTFHRWADALLPEVDRLPTEAQRAFVHRRVRDWEVYLSIKAGRIPTAGELTGLTDWMQRLLAAESTSRPVLTVLAATGNTKKVRNLAGHRAARDRDVT